MNTRITPERVLELKREATELSQREDIKHSAALARIAQSEGFRSWPELMAAAGGSEAVRDAKPMTESQVRKAERRKRYLSNSGGEQ
jgi:hypothetical protein